MKKDHGFTYLEILIAVIILGFVLVPMLGQFYIGFIGNKTSATLSQAVFLAEDLMDEIKSKRFDENIYPNPPTHPNLLGIDGSENPNDRRTFDDVDDYNGWQASPPQKLDQTVLSEFANYNRSVDTKYVTLNPDNTWQEATNATNYKKITVIVSRKNMSDVVLTTLVSNE